MSAPPDANAKPSPLFFNSARASRQSPFGRPGSIRQGSPSTAARPSTPTSSPLKPNTTTTNKTPPPWLKTAAAAATATPGDAPSSPSRNLRSPSREPLSPGPQLLSPARGSADHTRTSSFTDHTRNTSTSTIATPRPLSTASLAAMFDGGRERSSTPPVEKVQKVDMVEKPVEAPLSPQKQQSPLQKTLSPPRHSPPSHSPTKSISPPTHTPTSPLKTTTARPPMIRQTTNDALSRLPPPLLHSMRESFSVMDRDDDGHVTAPDVADMLSQLGLSATPQTLASYFNGAPSINLATYLNTLSDLLAPLSRPNELIAAFEAFDDGDDGQIDLAELKDALLHTAPEAGDHRLTEREIDVVVEGFSGRRAFGKAAKGLGRGEVFRYHEFMASLTGGGDANAPAQG